MENLGVVKWYLLVQVLSAYHCEQYSTDYLEWWIEIICIGNLILISFLFLLSSLNNKSFGCWSYLMAIFNMISNHISM